MAAASASGMDSGLPRSRRLASTVHFRQAFAGRAWRGRCLVLFLRKEDDAACRLGVVASRRALRRAVQRNRAKRLLREAFRLNRHKFRDGRDVVLVARRGILGASCQDVERDLLVVAEKAGLLARSGRQSPDSRKRDDP